MFLVFELSGEHETLPRSEAIHTLEALGIDFSVKASYDQCLAVDIRGENKELARSLAGRLAMTHNILEGIGITTSQNEDILSLAREIDFPAKKTYSFRVKRVKEYSRVSSEELERRIGAIFWEKGYKADLKNPDIRLRGILTEDKFIIGRVLASVDRGAFEKRNPKYKPFFYPGVLLPRVSRALVNLAKARQGSILLDPFCGTGGILIEAGLMGIKGIGSDVQRKIILGAKMNLAYYGLDLPLIYQDACRLALRDSSVDSVVTDPPYGRSALIMAGSLEELLSGSLQEAYRVLKKGGREVFISKQPIRKMVEIAGFRVIEEHTQRVHRSLIRRIYLLEK